ncbi:MAG TPA: SRPBCC domain-containing protein, partial [Bacteroidia bacterium]|nr:SRPBCC domain-containing protein [Bacteroidia bacterium]
MKPESILVTALLPVDAATLYRAWLSSKEHSAMTGSRASIKAEEGSSFTAWEGYISGEIMGLEPGSRILMSWRTDEFPEDADESQVEILLRDSTQGCQFTLRHTNIPAGDGQKYFDGWQEYYVKPMTAY